MTEYIPSFSDWSRPETLVMCAFCDRWTSRHYLTASECKEKESNFDFHVVNQGNHPNFDMWMEMFFRHANFSIALRERMKGARQLICFFVSSTMVNPGGTQEKIMNGKTPGFLMLSLLALVLNCDSGETSSQPWLTWRLKHMDPKTRYGSPITVGYWG